MPQIGGQTIHLRYQAMHWRGVSSQHHTYSFFPTLLPAWETPQEYEWFEFPTSKKMMISLFNYSFYYFL